MAMTCAPVLAQDQAPEAAPAQARPDPVLRRPDAFGTRRRAALKPGEKTSAMVSKPAAANAGTEKAPPETAPDRAPSARAESKAAPGAQRSAPESDPVAAGIAEDAVREAAEKKTAPAKSGASDSEWVFPENPVGGPLPAPKTLGEVIRERHKLWKKIAGEEEVDEAIETPATTPAKEKAKASASAVKRAAPKKEPITKARAEKKAAVSPLDRAPKRNSLKKASSSSRKSFTPTKKKSPSSKKKPVRRAPKRQ